MTASYDAVAQLFARYAWANDHQDLEMLEHCFTEDVKFAGTVAGTPALGPHTSRPAVIEFYTSAWASQVGQTRHAITNFRLLEPGDESLRVSAYLTLLTTRDGALTPTFTAVYDCQVTDGDDTRFAAMNLALDGPP